MEGGGRVAESSQAGIAGRAGKAAAPAPGRGTLHPLRAMRLRGRSAPDAGCEQRKRTACRHVARRGWPLVRFTTRRSIRAYRARRHPEDGAHRDARKQREAAPNRTLPANGGQSTHASILATGGRDGNANRDMCRESNSPPMIPAVSRNGQGNPGRIVVKTGGRRCREAAADLRITDPKGCAGSIPAPPTLHRGDSDGLAIFSVRSSRRGGGR